MRHTGSSPSKKIPNGVRSLMGVIVFKDASISDSKITIAIYLISIYFDSLGELPLILITFSSALFLHYYKYKL